MLTARAKDVLLEYKSRETGLFPAEIPARIKKHGHNSIESKNVNGFWQMLSHQFSDLMVIILLIAGTLALAFSSYRDAWVMYLIVIVNAAIGFTQEFKVEKTLSALSKLIPKKVRVLRAGKESEINSNEVVPGDIMVLAEGEDIPADAIIIEAFDLKVDESTLTGESLPVSKFAVKTVKIENSNRLYMGTCILDGSAKAVVCQTGLNTSFGRIADATNKIKEDYSPLQKKLNKMSKFIARAAMIVLVVFVIYGFFTGKDLVGNLLFALALAAAVVPEGLPATISVALSLAANRLAKKKALIKKLTSTESLGAATVICTDKTGTITEGQMKVDVSWTLKQGETKIEKIPIAKLAIVKNIFALCNNAGYVDNKIKGNFNEVCLLEYLVSKRVNFERLRKQYPTIYEIAFTPERKMMSVVVKIDDCFWLLTKGQPETVLSKCKLSAKDKVKIKEAETGFSEKALHNLSFAYKRIGKKFKNPAKLPAKEKAKFDQNLESNLEFLGLIGLSDPVKEGVKEAVVKCHQVGIRIVMITGDTKTTASAVASKINLFGIHHDRIFTGGDIDSMSQTELQGLLKKNLVISEVDPEHKLKIVENLQALGEVVAVTGDGVNDAPALKKADIGVTMGVRGTDVAKEAADMILLDDNFATIVRAVYEGRTIFENIQKVIYYVLSCNVGELTTVVLGIIFQLPLPILAVQILAVDLGTEVLPSLALTLDSVNQKTISIPEKHSSREFMSKENVRRTLLSGLLMGSGAVLAFYTSTRMGYSYEISTTAAFATLVICQFANAFVAHSDFYLLISKLTFSNIYLQVSIFISIGLLLLIIYWPPIQGWLYTDGLPLDTWGVPVITMLLLCLNGQFFLAKKKLPGID